MRTAAARAAIRKRARREGPIFGDAIDGRSAPL